MKKGKVFCFFLCFFLFCVLSLFFFNKVAEEQYGKREIKKESEPLLTDFDNISTIDAKLGEPFSITMGYLKNYAKKKSGVWYQSEGIVEKVEKKKDYTLITLQDKEDTKRKIIATIAEAVDLKSKDYVYFVGSINLSQSSLSLVKITKEEIYYQDSTVVSFSFLANNLSLLKEQAFLIYGYKTNRENKFYFYDSKEDADNQSNAYFILENADIPIELEGEVQLVCQLENSYTLKNCKLK